MEAETGEIPSFLRVDALNNFYFSVGSEEFEYVEGQFYRKEANLTCGDSFGQTALQKQCRQRTTVKSESYCEFACLNRDGYESCLRVIQEKIENKMVTFLSSVPIFVALTHSKLSSLFYQMKKHKFERGAFVFGTNMLAEYVYFVIKGSFEMQKTPPKLASTAEGSFARKFPHIKD